MNKISDRQIELLKKIYNRTITKAEAKEYITLVLTDNALGAEKLPELIFLPESKMAQTFAMLREYTLCISNVVASNIVAHRDDMLIALNAIGHELKHYRQYTVNIDELQTAEQKAYNEQVLKGMKDYQDAYGEYLTSLQILEKPKYHKTIKDFCSEHNQDAFAKWYLGLIRDERDNMAENLEESRYLSQDHETDARYSGILFADIMLQKYLSDPRLSQQEDICAWLSALKTQGIEVLHNDYIDDLELSTFYTEFSDAIKNVGKDFLFDLATKIANEQHADSKQKQVFEALLCLGTMGYTESICNSQNQNELAVWVAQNLTSQLPNGDATPQRVFASYLAHSMLTSTSISNQTKEHLFKLIKDMYFAHASTPKDQIKYGSKVIKFDNFDTFILHIAMLKGEQWALKFMEELDNNGRNSEVCKIVDFKKLYNMEIDIEQTLPNHYLNNISELLAGKAEMLIDLQDEFIGSKKLSPTKVKWYATEIDKTTKEFLYLHKMQEDKPAPKTAKETQEYNNFFQKTMQFNMKRFQRVAKLAREQRELINKAIAERQ